MSGEGVEGTGGLVAEAMNPDELLGLEGLGDFGWWGPGQLAEYMHNPLLHSQLVEYPLQSPLPEPCSSQSSRTVPTQISPFPLQPCSTETADTTPNRMLPVPKTPPAEMKTDPKEKPSRTAARGPRRSRFTTYADHVQEKKRIREHYESLIRAAKRESDKEEVERLKKHRALAVKKSAETFRHRKETAAVGSDTMRALAEAVGSGAEGVCLCDRLKALVRDWARDYHSRTSPHNK